jgi:hypothetical protein
MNGTEHASLAATVQQLTEQVGRLESELATLRTELVSAQRRQPPAPRSAPTQEQLRLQAEAWGMVLGIAPDGTRLDGKPRPQRALESAGLRFVEQHGGKLWLALLLLAGLVVAFRDRLA